MSIILEGIDGTGKTTFAQEYCALYPETIYIHNWAKPTNNIDILSEITKELLLLQHNNLIFDRSFVISEYVYATVLNRPTAVTLKYIENVIQVFNIYNHTVQLFVADNLALLPLKDEDKWLPIAKLQELYIELFTQFVPNKFILRDYTKGVIDASY